MIRIQGIHDARLLGCEHLLSAIGEGAQDRRAVELGGPRRLAPRELAGPAHLTVGQVERHDGIGVAFIGRGQGASGPDIEQVALGIDGGCRGDRGAGRGLRIFGNGVSLPHDTPGQHVERRHAAPERTTGVGGRLGGAQLARIDHDKEPIVKQHRCAGDARERVRIHLGLPQQRSLLCIERIDRAGVVTEEGRARRLDDIEMRQCGRTLRLLAFRSGLRFHVGMHRPLHRGRGGPVGRTQFADEDRRMGAGRRIVAPVGTAGPGIQRIDAPGGGEHKQPAIDHRRLTGDRTARKTERPLQRQFRNVRGPNRRLRLIPGVFDVTAPAIPSRGSERQRLRGIGAQIGQRYRVGRRGVRRAQQSQRRQCGRCGVNCRQHARQRLSIC